MQYLFAESQVEDMLSFRPFLDSFTRTLDLLFSKIEPIRFSALELRLVYADELISGFRRVLPCRRNLLLLPLSDLLSSSGKSNLWFGSLELIGRGRATFSFSHVRISNGSRAVEFAVYPL